jgi:ATP-binding cassette subfamily F protein uup
MVEKASDYGALASLQKEKEEAEEQLEGKMERWEYLEDLKLKIDTQ